MNCRTIAVESSRTGVALLLLLAPANYLRTYNVIKWLSKRIIVKTAQKIFERFTTLTLRDFSNTQTAIFWQEDFLYVVWLVLITSLVDDYNNWRSGDDGKCVGCWESLCLLKSTFRWNLLSQSPQANGLYPVCFRMCVIRLLLWEKDFPQTTHLWGFSPEVNKC